MVNDSNRISSPAGAAGRLPSPVPANTSVGGEIQRVSANAKSSMPNAMCPRAKSKPCRRRAAFGSNYRHGAYKIGHVLCDNRESQRRCSTVLPSETGALGNEFSGLRCGYSMPPIPVESYPYVPVNQSHSFVKVPESKLRKGCSTWEEGNGCL
jgi:hypothetical protein